MVHTEIPQPPDEDGTEVNIDYTFHFSEEDAISALNSVIEDEVLPMVWRKEFTPPPTDYKSPYEWYKANSERFNVAYSEAIEHDDDCPCSYNSLNLKIVKVPMPE